MTSTDQRTGPLSMDEVLGDLPTRMDFLRAIVSFVFTVGLAIWLGWSATDLAWGLWASSLVLGSLTIVLALVWEKGGSNPGCSLALFAVHFGAFHFGFAAILTANLPYFGNDGWSLGLLANAARGFTTGWPLIATLIFSSLGDFRRLRTRAGAREGIVRAYIEVFRLWSMVAVLMILAPFGVRWLALAPVLAALYFPWRMLFRHVSERRSEARHRQYEDLFPEDREDPPA